MKYKNKWIKLDKDTYDELQQMKDEIPFLKSFDSVVRYLIELYKQSKKKRLVI